MNEIEYYIKNTKVSKAEIENNIAHPITGKKYPNRAIFVLLRKYANDFFKYGSEPRFLGIAGLRGVGKTTLMWQVANELYKQFPDSIYFFNVNTITNLNSNLQEALALFQKHILQKKFSENKNSLILLFDEVHDDPNWAKTMKILYDEAKTAFIICTGSSALLLQQTADLARRIHIEKLYPFRFIEFITAKTFYENKQLIYPIKGLSNKLQQIYFYCNDIKGISSEIEIVKKDIENYFNKIKSINRIDNIDNLVTEYIKYHNIPAFLLFKEKTAILKSAFSLFSRIIFEDAIKMNNQFDSFNALKILIRLAGSDEINLNSLSQTFAIKKEEIELIIESLHKAEILNILRPYGGINSKLTKNKKIYYMSPTLRLALLNQIYKQNIPESSLSKIYEDIVVLYLKKIINNELLSFVTNGNNIKPDFIIETNNTPILIEVGTHKTSTIQITSSKLNIRYGILISQSFDELQIDIDKKVIKLPLKWFLLL